jgi:DNA-binding CsgD family transcriptional regulator
VSPEDLAGHAAVLDRWFAAFNAHDVDALCAIADPAVEVVPLPGSETAPPGTTYHGIAGLRALLTASFERFPKIRLEHTPLRANGHGTTVELRFILDDGMSPPVHRTAACDYGFAGDRIRRMRTFDRGRGFDRQIDRGRAEALSPREREVLAMLAAGNTVNEIAGDLVLSPLTVRTHIRNAKDKLGARTTAHAVALAIDQRALDV